jgi:hypothetical protein
MEETPQEVAARITGFLDAAAPQSIGPVTGDNA